MNLANLDKILSEQNKAIFVVFYASWCQPSLMQKESAERLQAENSDIAEFFILDIDSNEELAKSLEVRNIPSTIAYEALPPKTSDNNSDKKAEDSTEREPIMLPGYQLDSMFLDYFKVLRKNLKKQKT
ncbi:MAG: thioredoxin family protein [Candidatus Riflebacteria bacterium]|nr:thioredoxin family protein [Candidatus Riflebacteria bacterium]